MRKVVLLLFFIFILLGCKQKGTEEGYFIHDDCNGYDWDVNLPNQSYTIDCTKCDFKYRTYGKQRYLDGCKESYTLFPTKRNE